VKVVEPGVQWREAVEYTSRWRNYVWSAGLEGSYPLP